MTNESQHTKLVTVAGRRLETLWLPPASNQRPTIVMLHEALGSVSMWKEFPARLAERTGCGVFLYSRQGHGYSDALNGPREVGYLHDEAEQVLPAVLDLAGIERPVLLGHSDGAAIALLYASQFPGKPRGLVLLAPHEFVEERGLDGIRRTAQAYASSTADFARKLARYHRDADALFQAWVAIWLDPRFRSWNIEAAISAIRSPTLIIQGEEDEYGAIEQIRAITTRLPSAEVALLANCRHSPHRDQVDLVLETIAEFVERLPN